MNNNIEHTLSSSIENLQKLGEEIENLRNNHHDIFQVKKFQKLDNDFQDFFKSHQEAVDRLKNPNLSIAMIGTTSSGKSTVLNSLIAQQIAPIDSAEKSAGILTVKHSSTSKLVIEYTDGTTKEVESLSNEEIYSELNSIMVNHKNSSEKEKILKLAVSVPLLPACDLDLLGLPTSMKVEFIDLPGMNTALEKNNLAAIQKTLEQAFPIIIINYEYVNKHDEKALFDELKRTVESFGIDTKLLIFILNKCDLHSELDKKNLSLPDRIEKIKESIQSQLNLSSDKPIEILRFSSQSLCYAQCAWGPASLKNESLVEQPIRLSLVQGMFRDCFGYFENEINKIDDDKIRSDLRKRFRDLKDQIEDAAKLDNNITITDKDMSTILEYVQNWSGATDLWASLRTRVEESLAEIILNPALNICFKNYEALKSSIKELRKATNIENLQQIKQKRKEYTTYRKDLSSEIDLIQTGIKEKIEGIKRTILSSKDTEDIETQEQKLRTLEQKLKVQNLSGFSKLIEIFSKISKDLTISLITPVRNALKNNSSTDELKKILEKDINTKNLGRIIKHYESVSKELKKFTPSNSGNNLEMKVLKTDNEDMFNEAEKSVRKFYIVMQDSIYDRFNLKLQVEAKQIESAIKSLIDEQTKEIERVIDSEPKSPIKLHELLMTNYDKKEIDSSPMMPEGLFKTAPKVNRKNIDKDEVVGQEKKETGSCFNKQTSYVDKREKVPYKVLYLPNPDGMANQWLEGIKKIEPEVWKVIFDWLEKSLDDSMYNFIEAKNESFDYLDELHENQIKVVQDNLLQSHQKQWNEIENKLKSAEDYKCELDKLCGR
jgi:hypothetical protein